MTRYYKTQRKRFDWKHEAEEFIKALKQKAKKHNLKIVTELLPETKFISTPEFHESRIIGYWAEWYYEPTK